MQNVDELKTRVEETTEKLRAFQEGRNGQSQSLVEMLSELEEKYAAQSVELEYCRGRIDPLETANTQLASLMESLLDTIDAGFSNIDSDPLQKAAEIAGSMLVGEMSLAANEAQAEEIIAEEIQPEKFDVPEELVIEETASEEEMEEVPIEESDVAVIEEPEIESTESELSADDVSELLATAEPDVQFEDVSEAALALESEEDAPTADLPEPVVAAIAETAIAENNLEDVISEAAEELVAEKLILEDEIEVVAESEQPEIVVAELEGVAAVDDLESVAALAKEIEEESAAADDKPATSDIRALLERVEALAAKAGAMGGDVLPDDATVELAEEDVVADEPREAGAAA
ncbi:MAG: hypothetical protein ACPGPC_13300 [Alphaproteobacteria bacterium]